MSFIYSTIMAESQVVWEGWGWSLEQDLPCIPGSQSRGKKQSGNKCNKGKHLPESI